MQTKLQRAHRRLDVLARCMVDYHPQRLSQTTIAEVLGVSHQAISKSLRRAAPDDPEVGRIAALSGWTNLQPITPIMVRARARADTIYDTRLFRCHFSESIGRYMQVKIKFGIPICFCRSW